MTLFNCILVMSTTLIKLILICVTLTGSSDRISLKYQFISKIVQIIDMLFQF